MRFIRQALVVVGAFVVMIAVVACGSGSDDSGASSTGTASQGAMTQPDKIALPDRIKSGAINAGVDTEYPPYEFLDGSRKPTGIDVDLYKAVAKELGVEPKLTVLPFAAQIPAVQNGRFDMIVVHDADTAERQQVVDFMDIYKTSMQPVVLKGNPSNVSEGLCGATAASNAGSFEDTVYEFSSDECEKAGKPPLKILKFTTGAQEIQAILTKRAGVYLVAPAVATYLTEKEPRLEKLDWFAKLPSTTYAGWPIAKDPEFAKALAQAIENLTADGTWQSILEKHGATGEGLPHPLVNGKPLDEYLAEQG